jgi:PTS system fructose-specific IIC component
MKFIGVTSCPTGIAHTYMAAEALEEAAREAGHEMIVETQGAAGSDPLEQSVIDSADGVIFAADVEVVARERFAGKPAVTAGVKDAVNNAPSLVAQAVKAVEAGPVAAPVAAAPSAEPSAGKKEEHIGIKLRQWLMTGVSYLIPFVAAGGLLIALSYLINTFALGDQGYDVAGLPEGGWREFLDTFAIGSLENWATLTNQLGSALFGLLVPVLAGFIAFAMADRPGIAPGFAVGIVASAIGAGFLGGIAGGLLAGALVIWMKKAKLPFALAGVWTVVVIPLVGSLLAGGVMFLLLGKPIVALMDGLTNWLESLSGGSAVILGVVLGGMMAIDMGGPFNKVAYFFAVASLTTSLTEGTEAGLEIMAAVMAGGMVPPLALALATVLRHKLFTPSEIQQGKANWLMGASFITEGAIPFAASDPVRVIPTMMAGSATAGGLSMAFGCASQAPHGGVFVIPLITNPLLYLVAIAAGTLVGAFLVMTAKSTKKAEHQLHDAEEAAGIVPVA